MPALVLGLAKLTGHTARERDCGQHEHEPERLGRPQCSFIRQAGTEQRRFEEDQSGSAASMIPSPIDARRALRRMLPALLIVGLGYVLWTAWLLNPRIARHGYDIETILDARPDIVLFPPPEDLTLESDPIAGLSSHGRLWTPYTRVAMLTIVDDYRLTVCVREGFAFGAGASAAVDALVEASRRSPPNSRADRRHGFFWGTLGPR